MKLTINILTKNNENTIENTLNSIYELNSNILIGDLSSSDKTLSICKKYKNVKILELGAIKDRAKAKNELIKAAKNNWVCFIEPWEQLFTTPDNFYKILDTINSSYKINIIQNDLITKQIRIWHKNKNLIFKNPVFETVKDKDAKITDIYFVSMGIPIDKNYLKTIEEWRNSKPLSCDPLYYLAFYYLKEKDWVGFLNYSKIYLYQEKSKNLSFTMMNYYCAMIKCYIDSEKNLKESLEHTIVCLEQNTLMAEFWCLLGDIYYSCNDYQRAKSFYENAILLGSKRLKNDEYPIEISKYKEYPEKMINNCKLIQENTSLYKTNRESLVH